MFDAIDKERVFDAARTLGLDPHELYLEHREEVRVRVEERLVRPEARVVTGASLRCHRGSTVVNLCTSDATTGGLLAALRNTPGERPGFPDKDEDTVSPQRLARVRREVQALSRTLWPEGEAVSFSRLDYESVTRRFAVCRPGEQVRRGEESHAGARAVWVEKGIRHSEEVWEADEESFFRLMASDNPLRKALVQARLAQPAWPAPYGEIPLLWSPRAFSKLVLHFLRAFEGDLVLGNLSFLNDLPLPLRIPLTIEEAAPAGAVDAQGADRRSLRIFHEGRPRALACDRTLAAELAVPPTGHSRRESYELPPTIGFWEPVVQGGPLCADPLAALEWGIAVEDVKVLDYRPETGEIHLRLGPCHLVHQGEVGEPVAPVEFRCSLVGLLETLRGFSEHREVHVFPVTKQRQRLLVRLHCPAAVSGPVPLPGEVSSHQYW